MKKRITVPRSANAIEVSRFFLNVCREINKTQSGSLTLDANQGSTTVSDTNVMSGSKIILFPTSANAAADVGSAAGVYVSAKSAGASFTVTHPNNANADKTFDYIIQN
ncbi:MAG: hypothetical protein JRI72_00575 [Deltaproteobacteria bacterium]|nr:hypothetical protein [Deltaproteobacteria bacterium]